MKLQADQAHSSASKPGLKPDARVAKAEGDGKWQFLGILPLFDPPQEDAKATIAAALKMGVTVKMVTGDALAIAQ